MNRDGSVVPGSACGSRAGEGGPPTRTFLRPDCFQRSFRRAAKTSTRAACAPRIAAEPPVDI